MSDPWVGITLVVATFTALFAIFSLIGPLLPAEVLRRASISRWGSRLELPLALQSSGR